MEGEIEDGIDECCDLCAEEDGAETEVVIPVGDCAEMTKVREDGWPDDAVEEDWDLWQV
jgi:hypothetical protein